MLVMWFLMFLKKTCNVLLPTLKGRSEHTFFFSAKYIVLLFEEICLAVIAQFIGLICVLPVAIIQVFILLGLGIYLSADVLKNALLIFSFVIGDEIDSLLKL